MLTNTTNNNVQLTRLDLDKNREKLYVALALVLLCSILSAVVLLFLQLLAVVVVLDLLTVFAACYGIYQMCVLKPLIKSITGCTNSNCVRNIIINKAKFVWFFSAAFLVSSFFIMIAITVKYFFAVGLIEAVYTTLLFTILHCVFSLIAFIAWVKGQLCEGDRNLLTVVMAVFWWLSIVFSFSGCVFNLADSGLTIDAIFVVVLLETLIFIVGVKGFILYNNDDSKSSSLVTALTEGCNRLKCSAIE